LSEIVDVRSRYGRRAVNLTHYGSVPFSSGGSEKLSELLGEHIVKKTAGRLPSSSFIVQHEAHGKHREHGVFRFPRSGVQSQKHVLEGLLSQCGETAVDAFRIGVQQLAIFFRSGLEGPLGAVTETMESTALVRFDNGRSEELRQLSRCLAPQQVHLEETVLGVNEPERSGNVETAVASHRGNPERVSLDGGRGGEPRYLEIAL
jgi:hypothetical protein